MNMEKEITSIEKEKYKFSLQYLKDSADKFKIYCNGKPVVALDVLDDFYINKLFEKPVDVESVVDVQGNNDDTEQKFLALRIALEKFIEWVKEGNIDKYIAQEKEHI